MLRWRLTLGPLLIAALVGLCWLDWRVPWPGVVLLPLAIVVALLAAGELLAMFRQRGHSPLAWAVYAGTLLTVLASAAPTLARFIGAELNGFGCGWFAVGVVATLLLAAVGEMHRYEAPGSVTTNLALSLFAALYAGGMIGFLVSLRSLSGAPWGDDGRWGMVALASLIATVKMSDIGQYTVGRLVGHHKLAPRVSPGKTWEGAIGGIVFAVATAWLVLTFGSRLAAADAASGPVASSAGPLATIAYGLVLACAGIVGDLAASLLKRDAGVKDSSTWLPGFGGVVDLLDSLLAAAPVAYLFWTLGIVGP